jgi:hypothetical protein
MEVDSPIPFPEHYLTSFQAKSTLGKGFHNEKRWMSESTSLIHLFSYAEVKYHYLQEMPEVASENQAPRLIGRKATFRA